MMDRPQKAILSSLILASVFGWIASQVFQEDMMSAMGRIESALSLTIFTSIWTVGMAAMMFPAIVPMVVLYNRLVNSNSEGTAQLMADKPRKTSYIKVSLFVGSYLVVWAVTGIALLFGWSEMMALLGDSIGQSMHYVFGTVLIISGIYQFTPLKTKCLGYCESPMSFFMRRWSGGTLGAIRMGLFHGLYCLGCCWPYFLLMVALGWMNFFWMAIFALVIFGEKIWSRGIWIARVVGMGFIISGILFAIGVIQVDHTMAAMSSETMDAEMSMDAMLLFGRLGAAPVEWNVFA
jgi:predicted metal-binding membrane protein